MIDKNETIGGQWFAPGVNRRAILNMIKNTAVAYQGGEVHTLVIWQGGKMQARLALSPYSCSDRREVHSISKIFTATAMGLLWDEKKYDLDDRIVDLFRDKLDFEPDALLSKMTVRNVLAMNTGHAGCIVDQMYQAEDSVKAFLRQPLAEEPGGLQRYNTGASCLLGAIVKKFTGLNVLDYLETKLFWQMDMSDIKACTVRDGLNEAGAGFGVTVDDMLKIGRLYLQKGQWNGKQLLSAEWIQAATSEQAPNGNHDANWTNGYGLHWWRNYPDGFRGDGAWGQLCMVFPEMDAVVAEQGFMEEMGACMDEIRTMLLHLFDPEPEKEAVSFPEYLPPAKTEDVPQVPFGVYVFDENTFGFTTLHLAMREQMLHLTVSDGMTLQTIVCANGVYRTNRIYAKKLTPKLRNRMRDDIVEPVRFTASWCAAPDGAIQISVRFLSTVFPETWRISCQNGVLTWDFQDTEFRMPDANQLTARLLTQE